MYILQVVVISSPNDAQKAQAWASK